MSLLWKVPLAVVVLTVLVVVFYMFGLRTKNSVALGTIRRINRRVLNPRQMKSAGTPGAYASVVHHVGRTSGSSYETPIVTYARGDDLVVVLPYGAKADWVKNVLSHGSARIDHEGTTSAVTEPRLVHVDEISDVISGSDRRMNALVGTVQALVLRKGTTT